jgi:RNase P protein component
VVLERRRHGWSGHARVGIVIARGRCGGVKRN